MRIRKGINYIDKLIEIHPMYSVLDKYIGSRLIQFSTLDIEGFEYSIMQAFEYAQPIYDSNVQFCQVCNNFCCKQLFVIQIDIELHAKSVSKNKIGNSDRFAQFWYQFLSNSPYLPIIATNFLEHRKVTLINAESNECEKTFQFTKYFL
jgi:hypothetical protein